MKKIACSLAAWLLISAGAHSQPGPVLGETVQTENGTVRGAPRDPQGILVFKGIPFAAPPEGDLRWQAPQPPKGWQGTRDAASYGNRCWSNVPSHAYPLVRVCAKR